MKRIPLSVLLLNLHTATATDDATVLTRQAMCFGQNKCWRSIALTHPRQRVWRVCWSAGAVWRSRKKAAH